MNFMDRTAIGNARLYNMEEDLGLGEGEYQLAVSVLFITYCLFEVVSFPSDNAPESEYLIDLDSHQTSSSRD